MENTFEWRAQDMDPPSVRLDLYLFGKAFMGWIEDGFEGGYDALFYNGLVLGTKPTMDEAKRLCEHHVTQAFRITR